MRLIPLGRPAIRYTLLWCFTIRWTHQKERIPPLKKVESRCNLRERDSPSLAKEGVGGGWFKLSILVTTPNPPNPLLKQEREFLTDLSTT